MLDVGLVCKLSAWEWLQGNAWATELADAGAALSSCCSWHPDSTPQLCHQQQSGQLSWSMHFAMLRCILWVHALGMLLTYNTLQTLQTASFLRCTVACCQNRHEALLVSLYNLCCICTAYMQEAIIISAAILHVLH